MKLDGIENINPQELQKVLDDLKKAVTESNITGYLLVREDLSDVVMMAINRRTPLRDRLKRKPGNGSAHSWLKLTSMGTTPANGFFSNGGLPTATQNTYKRMAATYASLGDILSISLFDQMAGKSFADNKESQTKVKMVNVARMEEWGLIWGDSDVGSGYQFDGLNKQITSNIVDNSGAPLTTLEPINEASQKIFDAGGVPTCIVSSSRDRRKISKIIFDAGYRVVQTVQDDGASNITAGVVVKKFISDFSDQPLEIIVSPYLYAGARGNDSDYGVLTTMFVLDEASYLDDGNALQMVDLMPLSRIELPMSGSSSQILIAEFSLLQVTAELFQSKIINLGA